MPEDKSGRIFVYFGSTKVVPARRRREATKIHGRVKVHTLHLVVPFEE